MARFLILSCGAFLATTVVAQTVKVSGRVIDASGRGVGGAIVELVNRGLKDTTLPDGMYSLNQAANGIHPGTPASTMTLAGATLHLRLAAPARIEVTVHDLAGGLLRRNTVPLATEGFHAWNLEDGTFPPGLLIVRASIGAETRTFRYLPLRGMGRSGRSAAQTASPAIAALQKMAAVVDTLKVTAAG